MTNYPILKSLKQILRLVTLLFPLTSAFIGVAAPQTTAITPIHISAHLGLIDRRPYGRIGWRRFYDRFIWNSEECAK